MNGDMRVKFPGLMREPLPSGSVRWRVRPKGDKSRKIALPCGPDHPDFKAHYDAARAGGILNPEPVTKSERGTMAWLLGLYISHLEIQVEAKAASPLTLKERRNLRDFVLSQKSEQQNSKGRTYAELPMMIPASELEAFKDRMASTPGKARNVWKLLIAAYDFGVNRQHCTVNPARAVKRPVYKSAGGATPWTTDDLFAFKNAHPKGTAAHLALTLFMFSACRIGDAILLGRAHEERRAGQLWLSWTPTKKGSKRVEIPVLPPLLAALNARTVIGGTYLLTGHALPYKSPEGLRNKMQRWCAEAGIQGKSSHGIRKAAGHLLALNGATQYEIMAVHGHANASTSQVYTDGVERARLGQMAASKLAGMDW
ncbi:site-specific integrase [uncultured Sulfitobacter sp.]|uniref:site-specific integrase n=1 Tax=uncultured Sulfitobacter sp. TaxID=191468 RepID=UPI0026367A83|nr:site-specific integrase [uncultured Sulfitobacter sp.]